MSKKAIFKKADIILAVILLVLGLGSMFLLKGEQGGRVRVSVDGTEYGEYSLLKDQTVRIEALGGYNVMEINGVRCIQLTQDDNLKNISKVTNISVERLCYMNDLAESRKLEAGEFIYLTYKKSSYRSKDSHTVKAGESIHSISQQYGIRMSSLYRMNNLVYGTPCHVGQVLKLHR